MTGARAYDVTPEPPYPKTLTLMEAFLASPILSGDSLIKMKMRGDIAPLERRRVTREAKRQEANDQKMRPELVATYRVLIEIDLSRSARIASRKEASAIMKAEASGKEGDGAPVEAQDAIEVGMPSNLVRPPPAEESDAAAEEGSSRAATDANNQQRDVRVDLAQQEPSLTSPSSSASSSPVTKSPTTGAAYTGAYMNPAMRKRLEAEQEKKNNASSNKLPSIAPSSILFGLKRRHDSRKLSGPVAASSAGGPTRQDTHDAKTQQDSKNEEESKEKEAKEAEASAYEHGLKPGDHVYRWSHFAYSYPIQIHGIVLATSDNINNTGSAVNGENKDAKGQDEEGEEEEQPIASVTIADFGFTRKGDDEQTNKSNAAAAAGAGNGGPTGDGTATAPVSAANSFNGSSYDLNYDGNNNNEHLDEQGAEDDVVVGGEQGVEVDSNGEAAEEEIVPHIDIEDITEVAASSSLSKDEGNDDAVKQQQQQQQQQQSKKNLKRSDESFLAKHLKTGRRLNVMTLTDPKDIKKWRKVNYGRGLFGGGGDDSDGGETSGESDNENGGKDEKDGAGSKKGGAASAGDSNKWKAWFRANPPTSRCALSANIERNVCDDTVEVGPDGTAVAVADPVVVDVKATPSTEFGADGTSSTPTDDKEVDQDTEAVAEQTCGTGEEEATTSDTADKLVSSASAETPPLATSASGSSCCDAANEPNRAKSPTLPSMDTSIPASPPAKPIEMEEGTEAKTLEEMIAAANAVERKARLSPRKQLSARNDESASTTAPIGGTERGVRKSSSLANIWPWKGQSGGRGSVAPESGKKGADNSDGGDKHGDQASSSKEAEPPKLPKSDPAKIVLARVRFLLEKEEEDILPPYHVFNSNSECIAVWCKTGRWSSLQSDVFWHTTAIGNAKSSTVMGLTLAATQPWLIPALPIAAVAAVGAPYLVLHQSKKKCEEATRKLTDRFWAQADAEVFVEAIESWSRLLH